MSGRRLARQARLRNDYLIINYVNMFQFSLIAFVVNGIFLGRAYFDYFFAIVACLAILPRVAQDEWDRADQEDEALMGIDEDDMFPQAEASHGIS